MAIRIAGNVDLADAARLQEPAVDRFDGMVEQAGGCFTIKSVMVMPKISNGS
jgi:hypothetical protein